MPTTIPSTIDVSRLELRQAASLELPVLIDLANDGLQKGRLPKKCEQGDGGAYELIDGDFKPVAIFKPIAGQNTEVLNECATYLLDSLQVGTPLFANVPPTAIIDCVSQAMPRIASFQKYVSHQCLSWDLGPSQFPVNEVHKIGLLDLRIFNQDRNGGNILVKKDASHTTLVPIDHSQSFPSTFGDDPFFEWLYWPQCKVPFGPELVAAIQTIDVAKEVRLLSAELGMTNASLTVLKVMTLFVKRAVAAGLTLFEMGCFVSRTGDPEASEKMAVLCAAAEQMGAESEDEVHKLGEDFMKCITNLVDEAVTLILARRK